MHKHCPLDYRIEPLMLIITNPNTTLRNTEVTSARTEATLAALEAASSGLEAAFYDRISFCVHEENQFCAHITCTIARNMIQILSYRGRFMWSSERYWCAKLWPWSPNDKICIILCAIIHVMHMQNWFSSRARSIESGFKPWRSSFKCCRSRFSGRRSYLTFTEATSVTLTLYTDTYLSFC